MYNLYILDDNLKWTIFLVKLSWADAEYWARRILELGGTTQIEPI